MTADSWGQFITGPIEAEMILGKHMQLIHEPMIEELGAVLNARCVSALVDA